MEIVVYSRDGCHLCDDAERLLRHYRLTYDFELRTVNVDADSTLVLRYGDTVPVVAIDGRERFRGLIALPLLERLLKSEGRLRT